MKEQIRAFVERDSFQRGIILLILVNAVAIGLLTAPLPPGAILALEVFDALCLAVYIVELGLKLYVYGPGFFTNPWNVFDFIVISLSLVPAEILPFPVQVVRIFRAFRAMRVFRLVSSFDQMRVIVEATLRAIPGVLWTTLLMFVLQYVYAVAGFSLFSETFPQYFGSLPRSMFTLFEMMTLEGWNGVAEDVMEVFPWSWSFFVTFVILSAFILMNVVVGVIVNSVEEGRESFDAVFDGIDGNDDALLAARLEDLERQIGEVSRMLEDRRRRDERFGRPRGDGARG